MKAACSCVALLCALGMAGCHRVKPAARVVVNTYADAKHGVSFQYPPPWALTTLPPSSSPWPLFSAEHPPSAVVSVGGGDEPTLQATDFKRAEFLYAVRASLPPAKCAALASSGGSVAQKGQTGVDGIPFTYAETSDSGMGHLRDDRVYTTAQDGHCYLFDLALLRSGAGAAPGVRAMTAAEQDGIENEMKQILATVSFHQ